MSQEQNIPKADIEYNLLSQITHDVKGPFNGLIGFSELLLNTQNAGDRETYSLMVFQLASKSYLFLQLLISWLKLISNNYKANTTDISSEYMIRQALNYNEIEIEGKGIQIQTKIKDISVQADQTYVPIGIAIVVYQMARFAKANDEILIVSDEQKCEISFIGLSESIIDIFNEVKSNVDVYNEKTYLIWVANKLVSKQQFIHSPTITVSDSQTTYSFYWA